MAKRGTHEAARVRSDVREKILETATTLFYELGVHAVGVDLVVEKSGVAKTSLYRHFGTKDDLVAAFLDRKDLDFWARWDQAAERHQHDAGAELSAQLDWIGELAGRPGYRGCPQINVAAEFPDEDHPARKVAKAHKLELRQRLLRLAERLDVDAPQELAGDLAVLINGAFVSTSLFEPGEAVPLLHRAANALIAARSRGRHSA